MALNLNYGDQVLHILNSDPIWSEFRDQNHDLFIMDTHKQGMIAGGKHFISQIVSYKYSMKNFNRSFELRCWLSDARS